MELSQAMMPRTTKSSRPRRRHPERGMSLVEVLIAAAIMLFIALGVIPYFAQAMQNNAQGQDSTKVANFGRSRLEHFIQLPWSHADLAVTAGTERVHEEYFRDEERDGSGVLTKAGGWFPGTVAAGEAAGDIVLYARTTTIQQFTSDDLTTPLDSTADPTAVNVKEIEVRTRSVRTAEFSGASLLGGGKQLTVRFYKVK